MISNPGGLDKSHPRFSLGCKSSHRSPSRVQARCAITAGADVRLSFDLVYRNCLPYLGEASIIHLHQGGTTDRQAQSPLEVHMSGLHLELLVPLNVTVSGGSYIRLKDRNDRMSQAASTTVPDRTSGVGD